MSVYKLHAKGLSVYFTTVDTNTSVYYINKCGKREEIFLERDMKKYSDKKKNPANTRYDIPSTLVQDSNRLLSKYNWNRIPEVR